MSDADRKRKSMEKRTLQQVETENVKAKESMRDLRQARKAIALARAGSFDTTKCTNNDYSRIPFQSRLLHRNDDSGRRKTKKDVNIDLVVVGVSSSIAEAVNGIWSPRRETTTPNGLRWKVGNNKERVKPEKQARELGWHIKDVSMSYL
jgi:hypothetical protein